MKKKLVYTLSFLTLALGSFTLFRVAIASTPEVISDIFPDPVLAELVAINLNLDISDQVVDAELLDIFVLNLNADERVEDFTGIEQLQNLEHLYASYHGLTTLAPFVSLTNLRILDVEGNEITDLSPLSGMLHLEDIRLGWNPIASIDVLRDIPNIRSLTLFQTYVSDLSAISEMSQLEALDLSVLDIESSELDALSGLVNLQTFILRNIDLDDISFLSGLTALEKLILEHNLYIHDLTPLSHLTSLRHLEIINSSIEDVTPLEGLLNLEYLSLAGNHITNIQPLSGFSNTSIDIHDQWLLLPYIEVGIEQPFIAYDLHGRALPLVLADGYGTYEEGIIIWHDAGFSEFTWSFTDATTLFSGSVKQYAWEEWDDCTVYEEEDLHEDTGIWVDCPYEECVIDDDEWDDATEIEIFSEGVDYSEVEDDHEIRELESVYTDDADEDANDNELPQTGYHEKSIVIISVILLLVGVGIGALRFTMRIRR